MNIPERPARNDAFDGLVQAACGFARREIDRLADVVIDTLRNLPPTGIFGDNLAPRHMWDEYCWHCQEGSFDVDLGTDDWCLGTVSGNWETTVWTLAHGEVESLDRQIRVLLSAAVFEQKKEEEEDEWDGTIDIALITSAVVEDIEDKVSSQNIDVIGPHRGEILWSEITFYSKAAWITSLFKDKNNATDTDILLNRDADLNNMAECIVKEFFQLAQENTNEEIFCEFISYFAPLIRSSIIADTKESLEIVREELLANLDGRNTKSSPASKHRHERPIEKAALRLTADLRRTHPYAPMASKSEVLNLLHWAADEWSHKATREDARGLSLQLQTIEDRRGPEAALKVVTSVLGPIPLSRLTNKDEDSASIAFDLLGEMLDKTEPATD